MATIRNARLNVLAMNRAKIRIVVINSILVIAVIGAGFWGWSALHPAAPKAAVSTVTASVGDVTSTVSASGKVISPGDIGVSPTVNGVLKSVNVKVGDHVTAGQILASLDPTSLNIALTQAKISLVNAQSTLSKLTPTRTKAEKQQADLQLQQQQNAVDVATQNLATAEAAVNTNAASYQTAVDNAKKALSDAQTLATSNATAYQASVDAAKKSLADAQANAPLNAAQYQASVNSAKASLDSAQINNDNYYKTWSPSGYTIAYCQSLNLSGSSTTTINDVFSHCSTVLSNATALANAKAAYDNAVNSQTLSLSKDAQNLISLQNAVDQATTTQATNLKKDAQNLQSLQNAVDQAILNQTNNLAKDSTTQNSSVTSAKNALANAQLSLSLFKAQQAIALQAPKASDVDAAQAGITLAKANYNLALRNLAAATIRAPVTGDVASISSVVGESAPTASSSAATSTTGTASGFIVLTNVSSLRIQAGFSESDTSKIVVGQVANYTFAALPNEAPTGKVAAVDLLPSSSSGATSYNVTFDLDAPVAGLKPGMSATVTVTTGSALNVLQVSAQAVTVRGTRATVNVLTNVKGKDFITPTRVVVGLQGDSSDEILSGIKAGTKIVLRTTTTSVGSNGFPTGGIPAVTGAGGTLTGGGGGGFGGGGRGGGG